MDKKRKHKIDWLNHLVGLFGVVFGVLIAFWLNNWSQDRREQAEIRTALQNVRNELIKNQLKIDTIISKNTIQIKFLDEYLDHIDDNMEIKVSDNDWARLVDKYPLYLSKGSSGIKFNLELFQLSEVAWATTHRTGILSSIDFELAFVLEENYDLQEKVNEFDSGFISDLRSITGNKDSFVKLSRSLGLAIDLAETLRDKSYPQAIKAIDNFLQ